MLDGQAEEAVAFYKDVFDAKVESMDYAKDWPQEFEGDIPEGHKNHIMHAHLTVESSSSLMLADIFPGQSYQPGSTITIMLDIKTVDVAETLFEKLSVEGKITTPLSETGFSPAYGQIKDKFGIEWQIVTESSEMSRGDSL